MSVTRLEDDAPAVRAAVEDPTRLEELVRTRLLDSPREEAFDRLTRLAHGLLYIRGNWLRMPPLLLARHLFHKAFLSPRATEPQ